MRNVYKLWLVFGFEMAKKDSVLLSILMPAYNEEATIKEIIEKINNVDLGSLGIEKQLIVIDDCSTDGTAGIITRLKEKYGDMKVLRHDRNLGKGAAIKSALNIATGDIIIIQDADLEYNPEDYLKCVLPILEGGMHVVYGSRKLNKSNPRQKISYYLGGRIINLMFNLMFFTCENFSRLTDVYTCYKTFKSDILRDLSASGNRFDWELQVSAEVSKRGIRIYEVPISYYPRTALAGKKIKWKDGFKAMLVLLKCRLAD